MKRLFFLVAVVLFCMGGCYKVHEEILAEPARPITQTHVQSLHLDQADYMESLELKRMEFQCKMQEVRKAMRAERPTFRNDSIIVLPARPLIECN